MRQNRIPSIPIFIDSPLAVRTTHVFRAHQDARDAETNAYSRRGVDPFSFPRLKYIQDVNESKALNDIRGPFIVISASGMCEAGRILHHLKNNIENPRNTILITGFQAERYTRPQNRGTSSARFQFLEIPCGCGAEVVTAE